VSVFIASVTVDVFENGVCSALCPTNLSLHSSANKKPVIRPLLYIVL